MVGEDGHLRRDRFKGYSKDQILQIFKDNEAMVAAKDTSAEKLEDAAWKSHQHQLHDLLDAASAQEQANTRSANMNHRAMLEVQMKEQQERWVKPCRPPSRSPLVAPVAFFCPRLASP